MISEKIKKGYSENGQVIISDKVDAKTGKVYNLKAILEEYDAIIKQKNTALLLPFLEKNTKGNLEAIRKHIKKNKRYWMTYVDLSLEPGYKKTNNNKLRVFFKKNKPMVIINKPYIYLNFYVIYLDYHFILQKNYNRY